MDSDIVGNMIHHFNHQSVAFPSDNPGTREFAIDSYYAFGLTQPRHILHPYLNTHIIYQ